jgi:hypothetical protein
VTHAWDRAIARSGRRACSTFDEEGIAIVLGATAMTDDKIVLAAQGCPQAIAIFDGDTKVV